MDGERKKRKMDNVEAEEDNEEEKIEKFFALISSSRDVRERMVISNVEQKKKANNDHQNKPIAVWHPTFQPEDFMEDHQPYQELSTTTTTTPPDQPTTSTGTTQEAGPSISKKEVDEAKDQDDDKGVGDDHDLDLKLSL